MSSVLPRRREILATLTAMTAELTGVAPEAIPTHKSFFEAGVDSLLLVQFNRALQQRFGIKVGIRLLYDELASLDAVAAYLDEQLPPPAAAPPPSPVAATVAPPAAVEPRDVGGSAQDLYGVFAAQLAIVSQQLQMLQSLAPEWPQPAVAVATAPAAVTPTPAPAAEPPTPRTEAVGPYRPLHKGPREEITPAQQEHLSALVREYTERTKTSKALSQASRAVLADSRVSHGFHQLWKEMVYPIVADEGRGAELVDVDGRRFVDLAMGFGALLLGHAHPAVTTALQRALERGIGIGPQSRLAGSVAERIRDLTGLDRTLFCVSGTEAVMAALRLARTVTQRNTFAMFSGSYHGWSDQTLARAGSGAQASIPVAPGVSDRATMDAIVLDYDQPRSLERLRTMAGELCAILVEPVQSRRPDCQPIAFLRELRRIATESGCALIFDEMITGFRVHQGGCRGWFGVDADLVTFGKIIGGGLPIGVVAGRRDFMDAVDGGMWQFGDDSAPLVEKTLIAGTFAKHPLTLAAADAMLQHLRDEGPGLQTRLNSRATALAESVNRLCLARGIPARLVNCGSLFRLVVNGSPAARSMVTYELLNRGIFLLDGGNCFLSTAHTDEQIGRVEEAFIASLQTLTRAGWLTHTAQQADAPPSEPAAAEDVLIPVTDAQQELWSLSHGNPDASRAYNESLVMRLRGPLDRERLCACLQTLVDRHDALRTVFSADGASQRIRARLTLDIPYRSLTHLTEQDAEAACEAQIARDAAEPFDLEQGPMVRASVTALPGGQHVCMLTLHHILSDGWSFGLLLRELEGLYGAAVTGRSADLPPPRRLREYVEHQHTLQAAIDDPEAERFWISQFEGAAVTLQYPTRRAPAASPASRLGVQHRVSIDGPIVTRLAEIASRQRCTMYAVLLAAYQLLWHRLCRQRDLIVAAPAAGQVFDDEHAVVGFCVNMLPLRSRTGEEASFAQHLAATKDTLLESQLHQSCNVGGILRRVAPGGGFRPRVVFNLDVTRSWMRFADLDVALESPFNGAAKFDVYLNAVLRGSTLDLVWEFDAGLFDPESVRVVCDAFETLLDHISDDPDARVRDLPLLPPDERQRILRAWNDTARPYDRQACIQDLIARQAAIRPDAVAVVCDDRRLTYRQLETRANQLAHQLRDIGVARGEYVGILLDRSESLTVATLAVLKAGGAYVPIDGGYPTARVADIVDAARLRCVISEPSLTETLTAAAADQSCLQHVVWLAPEGKDDCRNEGPWRIWPVEALAAWPGDRPPAPIATSEDLAYVIFTSGSTGRPKGVMVQHRAVINLIDWVTRECEVGPDDRLLFITSPCFDLSVYDMFGPLAAGGVVEVASAATVAEPTLLMTRLLSGEVTFWDSAPAALQQLTPLWSPQLGAGSALRLVFLSGDWIPVSLPDQIRQTFGDRVDVVGLGGATEATVWSNAYRIQAVDSGWSSIPYGRPIQNSRYHVLDSQLRCCPVGVAGDLYIGGECLSVGYLGAARITADRYLPDPHGGESGARLYRTGDLARYGPDGVIEFLGRADQQVKIRGYRVELGEIEAALRAHPEVRDAVVTPWGTPVQRLVAYVIPRSPETRPDPAILRAHVRERLPHYMVPGAFIWLDAIPVTANGKLDRQALPSPESAWREHARPAKPSGPLETLLAGIWRDVLHVPEVGAADNFFELGGHSLLAVQILTRVRTIFQVDIPARALLEGGTVGELAQAIAARTAPGQAEAMARVLCEVAVAEPAPAMGDPR